MADGRPTQHDLDVLGLEHARTLFVYHAAQRHTSLRYFFAAVAIFVAAYVGALAADRLPAADGKVISVALGAALIVVTMIFWLLDCRNTFLVECDEALLIAAERRLRASTGLREFETVKATDRQCCLVRYGKIMPLMFLFTIATGVAGIAYGSTRADRSTEQTSPFVLNDVPATRPSVSADQSGSAPVGTSPVK